MNSHLIIETARKSKVEFRSYSKKILGYRFIILDETYFILNDYYSTEDLSIVLDELKKLSKKHSYSGFVMLLEDGSVYVDTRYTFDNQSGRHVFKSKCDKNIIPFDAFKYYQESLKKRGIE